MNILSKWSTIRTDDEWKEIDLYDKFIYYFSYFKSGFNMCIIMIYNFYNIDLDGAKWIASHPVAIKAIWWINEMHIFVCICMYKACVHVTLYSQLLRGGVVSILPHPQAGGPPLVACLWLLIHYIHSYSLYWRKLHNEELNDLYSSPSIVQVIKSRRMIWAGHVARMGESRDVCRVLVGKFQGKWPLGWPRHRLEDNIKKNLQEVGFEGMDWINVAEDMDRWQTLVNAVMNLLVP